MDKWNFIRTAYHLAKLGTISATAEAMGVHRATVLRHVDALEADLGVKLFQRNARGYIPTEAGNELMRVAGATEDQFGQMFSRLKQSSEPVAGEFIVTSLPPLVPVLVPLLSSFQKKHPEIQLRHLVSDKLFRLEYGEAHVAVRTGPRPELPDNVVLPFLTQQINLYAHPDYLVQRGRPATLDEIAGHSFVCFDELIPRIPVHKWILHHIKSEDIVFRSNNSQVLNQALINAVGIGFMFQHEAQLHPQLVELFPPLKEWEVSHWLVTHGDLHRSAKVQAFLQHFRSQ